MIQFQSVSKRYPSGVLAVHDFTMTIPTGSITVLVGPSGCGKTTLLRMVNRMVEPSAGRVLIDGNPVIGEDPVALRRRIGYVMQSGGLLPHKTVAENIATVAKLQGVPKLERARIVVDMMETVGLDADLAKRYPAHLSGGQQQRVGVARALAVNPNILLMDEPFGAVDPLVRADLQRELVDLQKKLAKTVLFVTHDIDEAFLLGDQVAILGEGGVLIQHGSPDDILRRPANDFVEAFIGASRGKRALRIVKSPDGDIVVDGEGRVAGRLQGGAP